MSNMMVNRSLKIMLFIILFLSSVMVPHRVLATGDLVGPHIVKASGPIEEAPYGEVTDLFFIDYRTDGREDPVLNNQAVFTSSNPSVGIFEQSGRFRAVGFGTTTVTATAGNLTASAFIRVPKPDSLSIYITDSTPYTASVGDRRSYNLNGYSSAGIIDMKSLASVVSSNPGVMKVESGELVAVSPGTATITAQFEQLSLSVETMVRSATNVSVNEDQLKQRIDGVAYINGLRQSMGLSWLTENNALHNAAQAHSNYIAANGSGESHNETPGKTGFTGSSPSDRVRFAGYDGSAGEVISFTNNVNNTGMKMLIDAPYHRILLLDPTAAEIGVGVKAERSGNTVSNIGFSREAKAQSITVYPYDGQTEISTAWLALESPNPLAPFGKEGATVGYPISIAASYGTLEAISASITDESGQSIDYYKTDHTNGQSNKSVFLIPKKPLQPNTTYTVSFTGRMEAAGMFERKWSFTTNNKQVNDPSGSTEDREPGSGESRFKIEGSDDSYIWVSNVVAQEGSGDEMMLIAEAPVEITFEGDSFFFKNVASIPDYEKLPLLGDFTIIREPGMYGVYASPEAGVSSTAIHIRVIEKEESVTEQPEINETATAQPTTSKVMVDGESVSFNAYNIAGNNYFKLRDFAMAVNGSDKQFEVVWNASRNAITLLPGEPYMPVGGELAKAVRPTRAKAKLTSSNLFVKETQVDLIAYNIGGNNYFKLRDIARAFNIGVIWDAKTNTVKIDTSIDYVEE